MFLAVMCSRVTLKVCFLNATKLHCSIKIHIFFLCFCILFTFTSRNLMILSSTLKAKCHLMPNSTSTVWCIFLKPQKGIKPTRIVTSVKVAESLLATLVSELGTTGSCIKALIWRGNREKKKKNQNSPRCVCDQYPDREGPSQTLPFWWLSEAQWIFF